MVKGHILAALLLTGKCLASPHHLFTSSFATPHLYALEFDDETNSIVDIANITAHDGHPWISFSYDKSSLYAGESDGFTSYTVENSSSLIYSQSVKVSVECGGKKDELGSPYVVAELRAPFSVFGASSTGCGAAMSVDSDGKLQSLVQSFKYRDGSSIKGLALDPDNKYLYSADESNNGIWIHLVTDQGTVNQVGFSPSPIANSGPKHLIIHPDGRYLYAVMSRTNVVAVFAINSGAGSDISRLTYTRLTYSLTPPGAADGDFDADDVLLSVDANVLFATTRFTGLAVPPPRVTQEPGWQWGGDDDDDDDKLKVLKINNRATRPGYITAILLTPLGERESPLNGRLVGAGFPLRQIFQLATTTSGGNSNSISPAPWSSDFFALADSEYGLIEVWKIKNLATVSYSGNLAVGARTAPVGGWVESSWMKNGYLSASTGTAVENANQIGGPGKTTTNTETSPQTGGQASGAFPWNGLNNGWRPDQSGGSTNDPWGRSGPQTSPLRGDASDGSSWGRTGEDTTDDSGRRNPRSGSQQSTEEEEDGSWATTETSEEDRKKVLAPSSTLRPTKNNGRTSSKKFFSSAFNLGINGRFRKEKRQNPSSSQVSTEVSQELPISASIVASWRAPVGGGSPGRLYTSTPERFVSPHVIRVRPWTGSKKRDIKQDSHDANQLPLAPTKDQLASYIKAQSEGRSCCTNAAWYD